MINSFLPTCSIPDPVHCNRRARTAVARNARLVKYNQVYIAKTPPLVVFARALPGLFFRLIERCAVPISTTIAPYGSESALSRVRFV